MVAVGRWFEPTDRNRMETNMKRQLDRIRMMEVFTHWKSLPERGRERGELVEKYSKEVGLSDVSIYARFKKLDKGNPISIVSGIAKEKVPRRKKEDCADREKHLFAIAGVKYGNKDNKKSRAIPTDFAVEIAKNAGLIPKDFNLNRTTIERAWSEMGISSKKIDNKSIFTELVAKCANHAVMVDATTLDQYYICVTDNTFLHLPDLHLDKNHEMQTMEKKKLRKPIVYYWVDVYSKSWLMKTYLPDPKTPGAINGWENSTDWIDFLTWCMLPKKDLRIPVQGAPQIMICDKGSGLTSDAVSNFCYRLGIDVREHTPKRSESKGIVEGRIGGVKRSYEVALDRSDIHSLDELNNFQHSWMIYNCQVKNQHYQKWMASTKDNPIQIVTEKNIHDATVESIDRVVNAYRVVSINKQLYRISNEVPAGTKVDIMTGYDGKRYAQTNEGKIYELIPKGKVQRDVETFEILNDDGDAIKKNVLDINRETVKKLSKDLKKHVKLEHKMPDMKGVIFFPAKGEEMVTHHALAPDNLVKVEQGVYYILQETGLTKEEIGLDIMDGIEDVLSSQIKHNGKIDQSFLFRMVNSLIEQNKEVGSIR